MKDIVRSMQVDLGFDGVMVFTYRKGDGGKVGLTSAFIDSGAGNVMAAEVERIYQTDLRKLVGELCDALEITLEWWMTTSTVNPDDWHKEDKRVYNEQGTLLTKARAAIREESRDERLKRLDYEDLSPEQLKTNRDVNYIMEHTSYKEKS